MGWVESRMILAERSIEDLYRRLVDVMAQVTASRQGLRAANQALPASAPPGGGGGVFTCPGPTVSTIASGASFTSSVSQCQGGSLAVVGSATVYNWLPAALVPSKTCIVLPDGTGSYVVVSQSCT